MNAIEQLCPSCGLCCNGVLFGDVELQSGDAVPPLLDKGIRIIAKGRKRAFAQPCAGLQEGLCRIYAARPSRCRTFECRVLQQALNGDITVAAARRTIGEAARCVDEVRRLVRALGDCNEQAPLSRRYAAIMAQPMDLADGGSALDQRGELMLATGRLVEVLDRCFLRGAARGED